MTLKERFLEIMNFNPNIRTIKWEFGYWGETIDNWYAQGLPRNEYPRIPSKISTPTSTLHTPAWTSGRKDKLPKGIPVMAGGLYWPTHGTPLDNDVKNYFDLDKSKILVNVNLLFSPMFEVKIRKEDEDSLTYQDVDGVTRTFLKDSATIPAAIEWPIKGKKSWEKLKHERLNTKDIRNRFPDNWDTLLKNYRERDYPLAFGGHPYGYFGTPSHILGYENLFYFYYDEPGLIHDIQNTFTELWINIFSEVLSQVDVDHIHIWEDISFGKGSMVSPAMFKEFILPYYKKLTGFLKSHGVKIILVDTDGDCNELIPLFIEGGVTGLYPFEVNCGMDIVKVRKDYPNLQICGGIPKTNIKFGKKEIDEILKPVAEVLKSGGFIPFGDHFIPPDVPWEEFKYYRNTLNNMIDSFEK